MLKPCETERAKKERSRDRHPSPPRLQAFAPPAWQMAQSSYEQHEVKRDSLHWNKNTSARRCNAYFYINIKYPTCLQRLRAGADSLIMYCFIASVERTYCQPAHLFSNALRWAFRRIAVVCRARERYNVISYCYMAFNVTGQGAGIPVGASSVMVTGINPFMTMRALPPAVGS